MHLLEQGQTLPLWLGILLGYLQILRGVTGQGLSEVLDTCDLGLHCTRDVDDLTGYSDSDWT